MGLVCCAVVGYTKGHYFYFEFNSFYSDVSLSEDIYNNTNEDSYNIFKHMVTM